MNWDGNFQASLAAPARPVESSLGVVYHYNYNHSEGTRIVRDGEVCPYKVPLLSTPRIVSGMAFAQPAVAEEHLGTKSKSKKRLSSHQLEILEEGFQEGVKLDPQRKTKLSMELGLEPRQVAVWFQNRRAKWKTKQMELSYDELKQEFDATCKERSKLQEEALKLKAILQDLAARKQYVGRFPGDETVGSS